MAFKLDVALYVSALCVFGSLNTIIAKVLFTIKARAGPGEPEKVFNKPWWLVFMMFVSMSFALVFAFGELFRKKRNDMEKNLLDVAPKTEEGADDAGDVPVGCNGRFLKKVVLVLGPAVADIVATGLIMVGFFFIPASIWQLLRGAEMVFTAILTYVFLGTKLKGFEIFGVVICFVGVTFVGIAGVMGNGFQVTDTSVNDLVFGMVIVFLGQIVQAVQVIGEEWLMGDINLAPMMTVGLEGVWGVLVMLLIGFPALGFFGIEDEAETWAMITNNADLSIIMCVFIFSCLTYNMSGIMVTYALSALHRVMLEALRTGVIWAFGLCVHYLVDPSSKFGEVWSVYSWIEVAGFVLLVVGQAVNGGMLRLESLFKYEDTLKASPAKMPSPKVMGSLVYASPTSAGHR